ncbi:TetR/AcrR family transcriptional regulator [Alkalicaulis satelles]|uniref:TetR/AcrR family transcriptional regulator n=1 Tax=Alkalicaulis satelles TaxID=2609175 RepID=A0A5M6ZGM2_9PROT|nr:TetR/AcrR family transcriptional regulator [Alkalicaulis satelles]KAA5803913.1 TetR/AcrR family transcriptional regulator [Alkalicaulis satelles]
MRDMAGKRITRRDERREATRTSVLLAAREVFLSEGYEGATIKMIAQRAGVSAGTVLNAEPSKAALLMAIMRDHYETLAESAGHLESALSGRAGDRLAALLQLMMDAHLRQIELISAAIGHSWLDDGEAFQRAFDDMAFAWEPVRRVFEAGVRSGELRADLDPSVAFACTIDVFMGALRECRRPDGEDPHAALSQRLALLIEGMGAR